jgi:hypothetical protein
MGALLPHSTPVEGPMAFPSPSGEAITNALHTLPTGPGTPFFIPAPPDTDTEDDLACRSLRIAQGASHMDIMHAGGWSSPSEPGELADSSPSDCSYQAGSGSDSRLIESAEGRCGAVHNMPAGVSTHQHFGGAGGCSHVLCPCRHDAASRKWCCDSSPTAGEQSMGKCAQSCPTYTGPTCCYHTSCIIDPVKHSPASCPYTGTCFFCK